MKSEDEEAMKENASARQRKWHARHFLQNK